MLGFLDDVKGIRIAQDSQQFTYGSNGFSTVTEVQPGCHLSSHRGEELETDAVGHTHEDIKHQYWDIDVGELSNTLGFGCVVGTSKVLFDEYPTLL